MDATEKRLCLSDSVHPILLAADKQRPRRKKHRELVLFDKLRISVCFNVSSRQSRSAQEIFIASLLKRRTQNFDSNRIDKMIRVMPTYFG